MELAFLIELAVTILPSKWMRLAVVRPPAGHKAAMMWEDWTGLRIQYRVDRGRDCAPENECKVVRMPAKMTVAGMAVSGLPPGGE